MLTWSRVIRTSLLGSLLAATAPITQAQTIDQNANGWTAYIRAAKLVDDGLVDTYLDPHSLASVSEGAMPSAQLARLANDLRKADYLGIQTEAAKHYESALEAAIEGNGAQTFATPDPAAIRGVAGQLNRVARLFVARSYSRSADGDADGGLQAVLDALAMDDRINGVTLVGNLYGAISRRAIYERLGELLPTLSLRETSRIQEFVAQELSRPAQIAAMAQQYRKTFDRNVDALSDPATSAAFIAESPSALRAPLQSLGDLSAFRNELRNLGDSQYSQMGHALAGDEVTWWDSTSLWAAAPTSQKAPPNADAAALAEESLKSAQFPARRVVEVELVRRAQLRLLGLHARLQEYRWHNHRLPPRLADFADARLAFDPLSGQPFVYAPKGDGTYELFSRGRGETGTVEMKYGGRPSTASGTAGPA